MKDKDFLGRGWSFPPTFDSASKSVVTVSDQEDVRQSLQILMSTQLTERIMLPDFGCDLSSMLFENITTTLLTKIRGIIERAILLYEPRIKLEEVSFERTDPNEGIIFIEVVYRIRSINTRANIVYPFYIREGTFINQ